MADVSTSGAVTISGGGATIATPDGIVSAPASLMNAVTGWFAIYYTTGFASTDDPYSGTGIVHLRWNNTTDTAGVSLTYFPGTDVYRCNRFGVGFTQADSAAQTFASGADKLVFCKWTPNVVGVSVDGGSFATVANQIIPQGLRDTFQIGARIDSGGSVINQLGSTVKWCAAGTTTVEDFNARQLAQRGDITDPEGFPFAYTFFWNCASVAYDVPPEPVAQIGMPAIAEPYPF